MKEKYSAPELELISLGNQDIITESICVIVTPGGESPWSDDFEG